MPPTISSAPIPTRETPSPLPGMVFDALLYLLRTGCPWRYLPSNFPPWQTVYYHFRQFCRIGLWTHLWRELRDDERRRVGLDRDRSRGDHRRPVGEDRRARPRTSAVLMSINA